MPRFERISLIFLLMLSAPGIAGGQEPTPVSEWALVQNDPNPFCASRDLSTLIDFRMPKPAIVTLGVLSADGSAVLRQLVDGVFAAGLHRVSWDGDDDLATPFPPGRWAYRIVCRDPAAPSETLFAATKTAIVVCEGNVSAGTIDARSQPMLAVTSANPFRDHIRFVSTPSAAGAVTLRIHDLTGRTVRTLFIGLRGRDRFECTWDGRTDTGRETHAGIYHAVLSAAERTTSLRIIRLR